MVECVQNLGNVRKKVGGEKGTEVVSALLSEIGYIGSWESLNAKDFYLPQSRPRVYGIFLRLSKGLGPQGKEIRQNELAAAWKFVARCNTKPNFERLSALLSRVPLGPSPPASADCSSTYGIDDAPKVKRSRKSSVKAKWVSNHEKYQAKFGLATDGAGALPDAEMLQFKQAAKELSLTDREIDASILSLRRMLKAGDLDDWQSAVLVGNIGDSVDRLQWKDSSFPCLLPDKKYLIIDMGQLKINRNPVFYSALQGIGLEEAKHFGLNSISLSQCQDLAGNAFAANICISILLAFLLIHNK
jgi:hypothetical protein